jgi:hypothetical protein
MIDTVDFVQSRSCIYLQEWERSWFWYMTQYILLAARLSSENPLYDSIEHIMVD